VSELLSVLVLTLSGWLVVRSAGATGWRGPALAPLAGVFMLVAVGFLAVFARVPSHPAVLLSLTAGAALLFVGGARPKWTRGDLVALSLLIAGVALLVALFREANLVTYHLDSFQYLLAGSLIAQGLAPELGSSTFWSKRTFVAPVLHSLAHGHGEFYLRSITPLFAAATALALASFATVARGSGRHRWVRLTVVGLALALLLSTNRFVWHALYINSHLFVAGAWMTLAAANWRLMTRADRDRGLWLTLSLLAIPTVIVGRPEGFLLVGMAIAPLVLSGRVPGWWRAAQVGTFGLFTLTWQLFVAASITSSPPMSVVAPAALGGLAIGVALLLLRWPLAVRRPRGWRTGLLLAVGILLAGLALRQPTILTESLAASWQNVILGAGHWGPSLGLLGLLVGITALFHRGDAATASLRFPLLATLPAVLLIAYLRGAAYRVGAGDSLSRMFIQFVPLAILYLAMAATEGGWGPPRWWVGLRRRFLARPR
jgi:hypothetical protein